MHVIGTFFLGLFAGVVAWVQQPDYWDHGIANIITLVAVFLALVVPLVWFSFFSAYTRRVRLTTLVGLMLLLAAGHATSVGL